MTRTRFTVGAALVGLVVLTLLLVYDSVNQTGVAKIVGYQHFGDERGVIVIVAVGALTDIAERTVQEGVGSVKITVHVRQPGGTVPAYLVYLPVVVSLHGGLRDRQVLDQDGAPVKDLGVYQPPFPSPRP